MKRLVLTSISIILLGYIITACGGVISVFVPTFTPAAPTATSSPTPIPPTPSPIWLDGRPPHFSSIDENLEVGYAYRAFLQLPLGMAWGPDGFLYIADWGGQHIVKVSEAGFMEDLGIWKELNAFHQDGPRGVAFDSQEHIYFNNQFGIYRANINGDNVEQIYSVEEPILGNIAIDTNDALYFTDSSEDGGVYKLDTDGSPTLIAKVSYTENIAFGPEGVVFVSRTASCSIKDSENRFGCYASQTAARRRTAIVKVDLNTGRVVDFYYPYAGEYSDSIYVAVDGEGNIWLRGKTYLDCLDPNGTSIGHSILESILIKGYQINYGPAGGIAFDDQKRLWLASGNSSLWLLNPVSEEESTSLGRSLTEPTFTRTLVVHGFYSSDLAISPSDIIYSPNTNNGDIWRIPPSGNYDAYSNYESDPWAEGWVSILVNDQEEAYLGLPNGSILKINQNGSRSAYVKLFTRSMTFGVDGLVYAVGGDVEKFKEIVTIDELKDVKTLAIDVAGTSLGNQEVHIAVAQNEGFYVFREENSSLYFLDYEDNSHLIADLSAITGGNAVVMTSSPVTGDVFLAPQENSTVFIVDPEGNSQIFATGFIGGVSGMAVNHVGQILYIAEAGAIDRIFLSIP
jgi:sugar lactone lactonase YvrE